MQAKIEISNDLVACNSEPIHIPGSIQPHGLLIALEENNYNIIEYSSNIDLENPTLESIFGNAIAKQIRLDLSKKTLTQTALFLRRIEYKGNLYNVLAHIHKSVIILELERDIGPSERSFFDLYPHLHAFINNLQNAKTVEQACEVAAREVRRLTGYGRALVYRFDTDWHGEVVAEDVQDERLPSLIGHHFPGSDIPAQARELYRLNRIRIIPDAGYKAVPLVRAPGNKRREPLDLAFSTLRSVSPVHVEYMKNMETWSSMSVSIIVDGKLWGLIACHNTTPKMVSFDLRTACEFIGQFLSPHIVAYERSTDFSRRINLKAINSRLLALMTAGSSYVNVLERNKSDLLNLMAATGAAIVLPEKIVLIGKTPSEKDVTELVHFIADKNLEIFDTSSLPNEFPDALSYKDLASGVVAISISKLHNSYILWFRPEVLQTVKWSGDPRKSQDADGRIHPRKSFETWKEIVHLKSLPWTPGEIEAAVELRNSVVGVVLKRAEELASLTEELEESNKELESFSYTVSHDLRAPFRHIVGYSELLKENEYKSLTERGRHYLDTIIESGRFAGQLVDNLLSFSRMAKLPMEVHDIDLNAILDDVLKEIKAGEPNVERIRWMLSPMPKVSGDPVLLKLVFVNLLANAVKYTRPIAQPVIEISHKLEENEDIFSIKDNGIGFDMAYADKLFGVFQRLHKMEEFEGTGIGLANVKRIVTRHGGRVWAASKKNEGAEFFFSLPAGRV